jgi:hypothetical protein
MKKVVSSRSGDGQNLRERVASSLARFRLDGVQYLVRAIQNQIVEPADERSATGETDAIPTRLRFARPGRRPSDIRRRCDRRISNDFISCRITDFDGFSSSAEIMPWPTPCYNSPHG